MKYDLHVTIWSQIYGYAQEIWTYALVLIDSLH